MTNNRFLEAVRRLYERYPVAFHVPGWLLYMLLPGLLLSLPQLMSQRTFLTLFGLKCLNESLCIAFFYLNYYVITPDTLQKRRPYLWGLSMLAMVVLLITINRVYFHYVLQADMTELTNQMARTQPNQSLRGFWLNTPFSLIFTSLLSLLLLTALSSGFAIYQDRQRQETRHQQMIIEKKEAELSALKLQISPHFLFNTLNNMRYLARQQSDQTADAIQRLSDMLRYMIYQADQGPVPLEREIDYLSDYIALQQLRLAPHNQVLFETVVDDDRVLIEPLLLIHFVENAFKYGMHHDQEATVHIRLEMADGQLLFWVKNRRFGHEETGTGVGSGIGIQNVWRRLALHYPGRHTLQIDKQADQFFVRLQIGLQPVSHETDQHSH